MSNIGDGFKNIIMAGIGALAFTGEKGKEIIDQLVEKGEITLDQGKELNDELRRRATTASADLREGALEARMRIMTPEERDAFAKMATEFAAKQNAEDAAREQEANQADVVIEDVEEAAAEAAEAVKDAAAEVAEAVEEATAEDQA